MSDIKKGGARRRLVLESREIVMWSLIFTFVCMFGVDVSKHTDVIEQNEFEGSWYVVSSETQGKMKPTKTRTESVIVFKGNEFINILDGKPDTKAAFVVAPGKKPKRMEIDFECPCGTKGRIHAIYEFKRDGTLRLAFIDKDAPETFETDGNYNRVLNLKRVVP